MQTAKLSNSVLGFKKAMVCKELLATITPFDKEQTSLTNDYLKACESKHIPPASITTIGRYLKHMSKEGVIIRTRSRRNFYRRNPNYNVEVK